jgi:hypothetical protein
VTYKVAVISTSINIPHFLELLAAFATRHDNREIHFFIAGDHKSPSPQTQEFCDAIDNCTYLGSAAQKAQHYKSSELTGFNNDSRRNIALLEALKWKPHLIVSQDDDMQAMADPFSPWIELFSQPFHGLQLGAPNLWFDHGQFTIPKAPARGLPPDGAYSQTFDTVSGKRIGFAQGIILGIPDTTATTAIANRPFIESANDILKAGFVVHPEARAVVNSQFTAFLPELAPAFAQHYQSQGRNTDILASVLLRRLARSRNLYTYYGPPTALHNRRPRPFAHDLKSEAFGMEHIEQFAHSLERFDPSPSRGTSVVDEMRMITENNHVVYAAHEFWKAWLQDVESVM